MKIILITTLISVNINVLLANNWIVADLPFYAILNELRTDSNYLYACGYITDPPGAGDSIYICRYSGVQWEALGVFDQNVLSTINYNGNLIAGGAFFHINGIPFSRIGYYDGITWYPMGNFDDAITKLKILNNELYAMGYFNYIDSVPINGIAKWNGSQWVDVFNFPFSPSFVLDDAEIYNGRIYVAGSIYDTINNIVDMAVYDGQSWKQVGQGFQGSFTGLEKLIVYKNELYASGPIRKPEGNVGNCIQKWNDTIWTEVGGGLKDHQNSINNWASATDMVIYNGELFVAGKFWYAGGILSPGIAKWDGESWCSLGTASDLPGEMSYKINFFNDTLFMTTSLDTLNGMYTNGLLKWIGGSYVDTCSAPISVNELLFEIDMSVYPNPALNYLKLTTKENTCFSIFLFDFTGRILQSSSFSGIENSIDISILPVGIYFLSIESEKGKVVKKFVKN